MDRKQSFIGRSSENDLRIALHYAEAFNILYNSKGYQDIIILPALFMVRQFLELGLKYNIKKLSTISQSHNLMGKDKYGKLNINKVHSLTSLHDAFIEHFKGAQKIMLLSQLGVGKHLDDLNTLVTKISLLDEDSQGFRYTENSSGQKIIDKNEHVNLQDIYDLMDNVSSLLGNTEEIFGLTSQYY